MHSQTHSYLIKNVQVPQNRKQNTQKINSITPSISKRDGRNGTQIEFTSSERGNSRSFVRHGKRIDSQVQPSFSGRVANEGRIAKKNKGTDSKASSSQTDEITETHEPSTAFRFNAASEIEVDNERLKQIISDIFTFDPKDLNEDPNIMTLEDSLKYFGLVQIFQELDKSLEDVRRHKRSKEQHEELLRLTDKEMQKLCLRFHPDRIISRGGSNVELKVAQKLQTALNTTRTVLNVTTKEFLEDLDIYYKYELFAKMELNSLGNEDMIKKRVTEVLLKIGLLSEIKQQEIVTQIGKFLYKSRLCIQNYIDSDRNNFEKNHYLATFYLKKCIEGYEKLDEEFNKVEKECADENLDYMKTAISEMQRKCSRDLDILRSLQRNEKFLEGAISVFSYCNLMDDYFVLPFAYYISILLMCSVMLTVKLRKKDKVKIITKEKLSPSNSTLDVNYFVTDKQTEEILALQSGYYLILHLNFKNPYKPKVKNVNTEKLDKKVVIESFKSILNKMNVLLEEKFIIDSYKVFSSKERFLKKLTKHNMDITLDCQEAKNMLSKHMECFQKENEERKKEFHKIREQYNEMEQRLANIQKRSSKLIDETSWDLSKENCDC